MADKNESFTEAAKGKQPGMVSEFLHFIVHNKKWWLTPLVVALLLVSLLVVLGGSGAAPFIYSLF